MPTDPTTVPVLHSVLCSHVLPDDQGAAGLPRALPEVGAHGGGADAGPTPRGGSNGRRGAADEFEGPHHGRESKNLAPIAAPIAALFVRADSHYHALPGVDAWDAVRDAMRWPGGCPVVAHPPCRAWGKLRDKANPRDGEKELARQAVRWVREFGGVLEHPAHSTLWAAMRMPLPRKGRDAWGGWTLPISQHWFGHRAEKMTWLYVVGCEPHEVPEVPLSLADPTHVVAQPKKRPTVVRLRKGMQGWKPEISRAERELTPAPLAAWLVELARRCDENAALKSTAGAACA